MAWLSGWNKRKEITLTGGSSGAQTDFQLKLTVVYDSDMKTDFSDLRFTKADGETLIDAWMESHTASTSAIIYVETDTPANTVEADIYMYYGNSGASSAWDIEKTFVFGDDFSGDLSKWTTVNGSWSISNGHLYCNGVGAQAQIRTTNYNSFSNNILECDWQFIDWRSGGREGVLTRYQDTSNYYASWITYSSLTGNVKAIAIEDKVAGSWGTTNYSAQDFTTGVWYTLQTVADGNTLKAYFNGVEKVSTTRTSFASGNIGFRIWHNDIYIDNVRVRKYVSNPATYGFGSEESEPSSGNPFWYYLMLKRRN